jgi:hypothetical protein
MRAKTVLQVATLAALACAAASACAQSIRPSYAYPPERLDDRGHVQLGTTPFFATPYVGVAAGYDDNLFFSHSNKQTSSTYMLSPGVRIDGRSPNKVLQLTYRGQAAHYTSSNEDDYVDHLLDGQFDWALTSRNFLRLGAAYIRSHDPRGSTDRPLLGNPDKYRLVSPSAMYAFGAPGAQGRIELYGSASERRYLNNHETTVLSDRDTREAGGAFYVRVMPRTYLVAEARQTDIRYKAPGSPQSADERRYFGGVTWEATAATYGTIKLGTLRRDFAGSFYPDESARNWEAEVSWSPRTYSKFDLYTVRTTTEATGLGSFILTSITGVTWTHAWNSRVTSAVLLRYQKDQYQQFDRVDDTKSLGFKVGYRFRRWLTLGAEYAHTKRDSNLEQFQYDRNFYLLTATASM